MINERRLRPDCVSDQKHHLIRVVPALYIVPVDGWSVVRIERLAIELITLQQVVRSANNAEVRLDMQPLDVRV